MTTADFPVHAEAISPPFAKARKVLASSVGRAGKVVRAVRLHNWSPARTVTGLAFIDAAAWATFGHGAGLLAIGASFLVYDWSRDG